MRSRFGQHLFALRTAAAGYRHGRARMLSAQFRSASNQYAKAGTGSSSEAKRWSLAYGSLIVGSMGALATAWAASQATCELQMLEKQWATVTEVLYTPVDTDLPLKNERVEHCKTKSSVVDFYVTSTYLANHPIEDRHDVLLTPGGSAYMAVFDGHGGWQVAEFAQKTMIPMIAKKLEGTTDANEDKMLGEMTSALKSTFLQTEEELRKMVQPAFKLGFGELGKVGACALMALCVKDVVMVANAGDVRAVIGRRGETNVEYEGYESIALTTDHNARVASEQKRLAADHPGEEDIIRCKNADACYVKGRLQPTRSLGDFYLKYPEFNGPPYVNGDRSRGRHIPMPYTPPYITADPEISLHKLHQNDEFLVIATDGLWDFMSNEEVVEVVRHQAAIGAAQNAAIKLIECAITRSAKKYGLTIEEVLDTPPGKTRRKRHDDISIVVLFFNKNRTSAPAP